jgi:hypothetical protein
MKKAVCVGINNYPGTSNDLKGCINDANDWAGLLGSFGFQTSKILDDQATKKNILDSIKNLIAEASAGDVVVFTYSGHGTSVLDQSGDEADSFDEALYVYDGTILDDELREIIAGAKKEAQIVIITDSCFSGTVTKAIAEESAKPRFIETDVIPPSAVLKKRFLSKVSDESMLEILLSGCSDKEYSYDAFINGKWNGALTAYAVSLIESGQTYNEFYSKLRSRLPSAEYPQTPQLEGSDANKNNKIFAEKPSAGPGDPDSGDGSGGTGTGGNSGSSGCFSTLLSILAISAFILIILSMAL